MLACWWHLLATEAMSVRLQHKAGGNFWATAPKHKTRQTISTWEVEQLAYLLGKMKAIQEGEGTLLDQSMVFFSSEIEDGNTHGHTNLPVLVAGRGGGAFSPGRHIVYPDAPPIASLFLSMLHGMGAGVDEFGNEGKSPLPGLTG